jgi:hypothetical protein
VERVEQVDEVELASCGRRGRARARSDEADDLAADERGEHLELRALRGPVRPQLGEALGRDVLESSLADEVVVGLVPAGGVDPSEGLGIHVANGTDDDVGLELGFHGQTLRPARAHAAIG